ncbi:uncharacterized protein PHALS_08539 [Plasmopara halstedii]|uniref:Uncharacterized protein n=1 Tax=Plasmopara halstedii TaxID=4781 RepID=A0A0N7L4E7_PLAHL|nr:uncharacterized protein PHALS_08539 [Plasmopara halstedii]CEG38467.1 hypothetical protein PHALS_08539 [Plasmopara halstedii]|eukprot:XP_024574836.1 hypothetical protein PHALS_08539 [Plasmopara halstedii]
MDYLEAFASYMNAPENAQAWDAQMTHNSRSCKVMTNSPLGKMQWESTSEILAAFGDDEGGANLDYYHRRTPFATLARVSP